MYLLKYLIIVISISSCLTLKTKFKQEQSILITFLGIHLFTYLLGLLNLLKYSIILIYGFTLISLIYLIIMIIKDKKNIKNIITFPVVVYIIILSLTYFLTKNMSFYYYDEFMFWGTNLKGMVYKNILWANKLFDGIHLTYPPLTGINGYIFCKFNGFFRIGAAYFGNITFLVTLVLVLFKGEKLNLYSFFKIVLTYILLYVCVILFQFELSSILIDLLLGVTFFVAFYLVHSKEDKSQYWLIGLVLISLTLMKITGILLALIVLFYLFIIDVFLNKNENLKKRILPVVLILLSVMALFLSWQMYCNINGKETDERHDKHNVEDIDLVEFFYALTLQEGKCSDRNYRVAKDFYNQLCSKDTSVAIKISSVSTIVIINIIGLIIAIKRKDKKIGLAYFVLNLGFIGYILSILFTYLFVFVEYQGDVLMDMYRYINMYLIVYVFFTIFVINEKFNDYIIISQILILLILINVNFKYISDYFVRSFTLQLISSAEYDNSIYIKNRVNIDDKIFIVDKNYDFGTGFMKFRYLISPIQTNLLYEWNITTEQPGLYYQTQISEEELKNILINEGYDYIYLYSIDQKFIDEYSELFSNCESRRIYKIQEINGEVYFSLVR